MLKKSILKNPRWRTTAILKNVKCNISAAVPLTLMTFGIEMNISCLNLVGHQKLKNMKIQDGGYTLNTPKLLRRTFGKKITPQASMKVRNT